jgi:cell pole-organizing protein PopZ
MQDINIKNKSHNIEDILKSVRTIINNHEKINYKEGEDQDTDEEEILELTSVVQTDQQEIISDEIKKQVSEEINKFANIVKEKNSNKNDSLECLIESLVKPLIKDWIEHNLTQVIERILKEELKKIIPK